MEKFLWRFNWDCGRQGSLDGLFVATEEDIKSIIGKNIYFGEVLGKHSEIVGEVEDGDFEKIKLSPNTVIEVESVLGDTWSGYNPFHYLDDSEE